MRPVTIPCLGILCSALQSGPKPKSTPGSRYRCGKNTKEQPNSHGWRKGRRAPRHPEGCRGVGSTVRAMAAQDRRGWGICGRAVSWSGVPQAMPRRSLVLMSSAAALRAGLTRDSVALR